MLARAWLLTGFGKHFKMLLSHLGDDIYVPFVALPPDACMGVLASLEVTLSVTPGTVTVITLPENARGFRLYPRTNTARFAVGEAPEAVATVGTADQVVAAADFAIGGIAKADIWESRLLDDQIGATARTLQISSATASTVCDVEIF